MNTFKEAVLGCVRNIPRGETRSYKEVAQCAGNPEAARAVGSILHTNYDPSVPCHRVVKSDGSLGGYNRGVQKKQSLLEDEGAVGA